MNIYNWGEEYQKDEFCDQLEGNGTPLQYFGYLM